MSQPESDSATLPTKDAVPGKEVTPQVPPASAPEDRALTDRDSAGKFVAGKSGNPAGRPKGSKSMITRERQALEAVLREYMNKPEKRETVIAAIDRLMNIAAYAKDDKIALGGIKLLTDKVLAQSKQEDDSSERETPVVHIVIDNYTAPPPAQLPMVVIDHPATEEIE